MWSLENADAPYPDRYEVADSGGVNFFRETSQTDGGLNFVSNDDRLPFREMPGIARADFEEDGRIVFAREKPFGLNPDDHHVCRKG